MLEHNRYFDGQGQNAGFESSGQPAFGVRASEPAAYRREYL